MATDGVCGVEEQIQQHLLDQFANAPDARQRRGQVESQRDFVLELVAQKLLSLGNKLVDIAQFLLLPCPGKPQHGFHDAGTLLHHGFDPVHARPDFLAVVEVGFDNLRRTFDNGKNAVKVVCNPCC